MWTGPADPDSDPDETFGPCCPCRYPTGLKPRGVFYFCVFVVVSISVLAIVAPLVHPKLQNEFFLNNADIESFKYTSEFKFNLTIVNTRPDLDIHYDGIRFDLIPHRDSIANNTIPPFSQAPRGATNVTVRLVSDHVYGDSVGEMRFTLWAHSLLGYKYQGHSPWGCSMHAFCDDIVFEVKNSKGTMVGPRPMK